MRTPTHHTPPHPIPLNFFFSLLREEEIKIPFMLIFIYAYSFNIRPYKTKHTHHSFKLHFYLLREEEIEISFILIFIYACSFDLRPFNAILGKPKHTRTL